MISSARNHHHIIDIAQALYLVVRQNRTQEHHEEIQNTTYHEQKFIKKAIPEINANNKQQNEMPVAWSVPKIPSSE
jgi:hypothetical protein